MSDNASSLGPLSSVMLELKAELGRCSMRLHEVLGLGSGAIVTLDRAAGAPLDLMVNGELIARGDIIAIDDRYGLRITEVAASPLYPRST